MENNMQAIQLKPVGIVRNQTQKSNRDDGFNKMEWRDKADVMKKRSKGISELVINPELEDALDGIDAFSHLMVLYWAHRSPSDKKPVTRVHPLGSKDFPMVGVFSTHSPVRPNNILVTIVSLKERKGNILTVEGLDAIDGSPILDIKPFMPDHYKAGDVRMPEWIHKMNHVFREEDKGSE